MSAIEYVFNYINLINLSDIIDIAIVAFLIYYLIKWLRESRAMQLVKGILLVFVVMVISELGNLTMLNYIVNTLVQVGMFAIVVLFQPELRSILEKLGRSSLGKIIDFTKDKTKFDQHSDVCEEIVTAVMNMASTRTGALIVIERETKLGEIKTGTSIDANISLE